MNRRQLLQGTIALPVLPSLLAACSDSTPNRYLLDNYAPVAEELTSKALNVIGELPKDLIGRYLRIGPNPGTEIDPGSHHWFLGRGMVHGIRLDEGRADWYRSRFIGAPEDGNSPNTNVFGFADKTIAAVESGGLPVELDYELRSVANNTSFGGGFTAHPKWDPDADELHAICYDWANLRDHVRYVVIDSTGDLRHEVEIPLPGMPMVHDMSLTPSYVVIFDLPVTLSFMALAGGATFPFRWDEEYEPRVGLLPRNGTAKDIIWSPISPQAVFHPMNAYEDAEGRVVIDIMTYRTLFKDDVRGPFGDSAPRFDRWTINPATRTVNEEVVDADAQEFPRCHPELNGKPYRYGYTVAVDGYDFPAILKHDLQTGTRETQPLGAGRQGAEPIFVPKEDGDAEDEGYLMTYVFDGNDQRSEFVVYDAQDFSREPLARVQLPGRVPYGFHGNWVPDEAV